MTTEEVIKDIVDLLNKHLPQSYELTDLNLKVAELIKKSKKFTPPTLDELVEYLKSKNYLDPYQYANDFINHYEANGWKVGKVKMQNWKAATNSWSSWQKRGTHV